MLLVNAVVPVADRRLGHLRDLGDGFIQVRTVTSYVR
jgi:hypothetical protein